MNASEILFLIPILPLAGAAINGLFGKRLPRGAVGPIACLGPAAAFALSLFGWYSLDAGDSARLESSIGDWIAAGGFTVEFGFVLDRLSSVMALVVTGVGSLIHVYSIGYMKGDPGYARYFAYLNLFLASMLILVLADNLVFLFLGWEGVGLCSYLLIGFWFDDEANARAGKKAFVVNRIGDFGFIIGILLAYAAYHTVAFETLNVAASAGAATGAAAGGEALAAIARVWVPLLLFIGATGKSAQIPLFVWLPDAMAGPTPVSALIHAATMVTSGVYLVARLYSVFDAAPELKQWIAVVGAATALAAGFIALSQFDIKKVLAYSTVSQLGYMFLAAGVGAYGQAIFHLMTHAFFKGLLFLGAGSVIHAMHHEQDMRRMGGLRSKLPATFTLMLIGSLAISGCPLLAGFFSKDGILEAVHRQDRTALWIVGLITAAMTSFYTFRLIFMTFFGEAPPAAARPEHTPEPDDHGPLLARDHGADLPAHAGVRESPTVMLAPMAVLAAGSVLGGYLDVPGRVDSGVEAHGVLGALFSAGGLIGTAAFASGLALAWFFYVRSPASRAALVEKPLPGRVLYRLSERKLFVDEIYQVLVVKPLDILAQLLFFVVDRLLIDWMLVAGSAFVARCTGAALRRLQSGRVPTYAGWLVGGVIALLIFVLTVLRSH